MPAGRLAFPVLPICFGPNVASQPFAWSASACPGRQAREDGEREIDVGTAVPGRGRAAGKVADSG